MNSSSRVKAHANTWYKMGQLSPRAHIHWLPTITYKPHDTWELNIIIPIVQIGKINGRCEVPAKGTKFLNSRQILPKRLISNFAHVPFSWWEGSWYGWSQWWLNCLIQRSQVTYLITCTSNIPGEEKLEKEHFPQCSQKLCLKKKSPPTRYEILPKYFILHL